MPKEVGKLSATYWVGTSYGGLDSLACKNPETAGIVLTVGILKLQQESFNQQGSCYTRL